MSEVDDRELLESRHAISDRQLLLAKDPMVMLDRARKEALYAMEKHAQRLALTFDEGKVEIIWECRASLLTAPDPDEIKRREVLKVWSEQDSPRLLAPNHRMGQIWLDMNRDLVPGLTKTANVITSSAQMLRGYRGTLLIVQPGYRSEDYLHNTWRDFENQVYEITSWGALTTWTETLP